MVLQFTVPTVNTDSSGPADLRRIEVYAHTGPLPAPADFLKFGTLVARIEVRNPKEQRAESEEQEPVPPKQDEVRGCAGGPVPPKQDAVAPAEAEAAEADSTANAVEQGATISVREPLTDAHKEIGPMPPTRPIVEAPAGTAVVIERLETPGTINFELPPQRYYTVVGVSLSRNRRGPYAGPLQVPLAEPPAAPEKVDAAYTASADIAHLAALAGRCGACRRRRRSRPRWPSSAPARKHPARSKHYSDVETEDTQEPGLALLLPPESPSRRRVHGSATTFMKSTHGRVRLRSRT